ncbi:polysaccharide deacetylase family protein [Tumebacillus permanentifrigoris]|uniref:Peptidoglycan/xylan/chitin deacetylase (PgdA/CDA1 family) n=1 Tax=Tumebacillus permanentifrigoris TaxID=378543 RepID=A0A316D882_9BACL|nr:polysaccharide deacetylase family protein [Tumebacillus permanentifrigoris]PWK12660.1 peptidoglycan/xylan/chitin deacetylase (PgdA/CDA1 family) [Tumebacillus permanentifrigoris]
MKNKTTSTARRVQAGKLLAAAAVCLLLFSGLSDTMAINTYVRDLKGLALPVQSYNTAEQAVALTFDVGASDSERVADVLQQLRAARVHATFFLTGEWVEKNPRTALEIVRQGHEVGHTLYTYQKATEMSEDEVQAQLTQADKAWQKAGLPDSTLFRIPFGESKGAVAKAIRERHENLIAWTTNLAPEPGQDAVAVWSGLETSLHAGDILRLRTDGETAKQLPKLLQRVQKAGYQWRTCSDLQGEVRS